MPAAAVNRPAASPAAARKGSMPPLSPTGGKRRAPTDAAPPKISDILRAARCQKRQRRLSFAAERLLKGPFAQRDMAGVEVQLQALAQGKPLELLLCVKDVMEVLTTSEGEALPGLQQVMAAYATVAQQQVAVGNHEMRGRQLAQQAQQAQQEQQAPPVVVAPPAELTVEGESDTSESDKDEDDEGDCQDWLAGLSTESEEGDVAERAPYRSAAASVKVAPGKRITWRRAIQEGDAVRRDLSAVFSTVCLS